MFLVCDVLYLSCFLRPLLPTKFKNHCIPLVDIYQLSTECLLALCYRRESIGMYGCLGLVGAAVLEFWCLPVFQGGYIHHWFLFFVLISPKRGIGYDMWVHRGEGAKNSPDPNQSTFIRVCRLRTITQFYAQIILQ